MKDDSPPASNNAEVPGGQSSGHLLHSVLSLVVSTRLQALKNSKESQTQWTVLVAFKGYYFNGDDLSSSLKQLSDKFNYRNSIINFPSLSAINKHMPRIYSRHIHFLKTRLRCCSITE